MIQGEARPSNNNKIVLDFIEKEIQIPHPVNIKFNEVKDFAQRLIKCAEIGGK